MDIFKINKFILIFTSLAFLCHSQAETSLTVMTSSSLLGKGSLGEYLEKEFPKFCPSCEVKFKSTDEMSGLLGKLRSEKSKKAHSFDAVLGLDSHFYVLSKDEGLVKEGVAYDQSPMAIIVDTKKFPEKEWPHSWEEISTKLANSLFISDPRLSSPGFEWLSSIFVYKLQSLENSKKTVARIFPSWSSAYGAFLKGESKAVWSYQSSEAYHRCNEKTEEQKFRYKALPLKEGYPLQIEYFSEAAFSHHPLAKKFAAFLISDPVQLQIPTTNWMFPAISKTKLPDCYKGMAPFSAAAEKAKVGSKEIQVWTDQWAL